MSLSGFVTGGVIGASVSVDGIVTGAPFAGSLPATTPSPSTPEPSSLGLLTLGGLGLAGWRRWKTRDQVFPD